MAEPGKVQSFDVEELLAKSGEILRREVTNLMIESTSKKLSATSARDLVAYVRLLHELREQQLKDLASLTEDELKALVHQD